MSHIMTVLSTLRIHPNMCHCIHKGGSCKYFDKGVTYKSQTSSPLKIKCNSTKHDTVKEGGTNGCYYCCKVGFCNVCCTKRIYTKSGASYKGWPKAFSSRKKTIGEKVSQSFREKEAHQSNQSKNPIKKIAFKGNVVDRDSSQEDANGEKFKDNPPNKKWIKNDFWRTHNHIYRYIEKNKCSHCQNPSNK